LEKVTEPEITSEPFQEIQPFFEFSFNFMTFGGEQSGKDVILFREKGLVLCDLVDDLKVHIGNEGVGVEMQEIPRIAHPQM